MNKKQLDQLLSQMDTIKPSLSKEGIEKLNNLKAIIQDTSFHPLNESHVVTHPASESKKTDRIGTTLLNLYSELERTARRNQDESMEELVTSIQQILGIEEKDGYFP